MHGICARQSPSHHAESPQLQLESLENRYLLSATAPDAVETTALNATPNSSHVADTFDAMIELEVTRTAAEQIPFREKVGPVVPSAPPYNPVPAIPFDDSIDPVTDCPGIERDFCLPGDINNNGEVDFLDFLKLSQNFGATQAGWEDGDLDGDKQVTFNDFLIFSSHFDK